MSVRVSATASYVNEGKVETVTALLRVRNVGYNACTSSNFTATLLAGGGVALSSHGAKAATRLAVNTFPEPFSNIALSVIEDVIAVGASVLMALHPLVILAIVAIFLVFSVLIARRIIRALSGLFRAGPTPSVPGRDRISAPSTFL